MNNYRSLNHTKWECQYHVVFIPKYRRKTLYGGLRHYLGDVLRRLAEQRESRVEEGHLLADHVHMLVSIPPKYSVAQVIGYIKGKSAIHIAREFAGRPGSTRYIPPVFHKTRSECSVDHARGLVFHRPQAASHRRAVVYFCSAVLTECPSPESVQRTQRGRQTDTNCSISPTEGAA